MSVFNGERYLRESADSILRQTFSDFEFIIVNDGSTDGSPDILAEYARQDGRIRVIDQENQGLTRALIRGCAEARGRYIARQDADDVSEPRRLRKLTGLLDGDPGLAFTSSWGRFVEPGGAVCGEVIRPADGTEATHVLLHCRQGPSAHGSVMFRKDSYERVGGYRPEFYYAQDSDLWLRLALVGKIAYAQQFLYTHRVAPEGISFARRGLQCRFAELGQACHAARLRGESEAPWL